MKTWDKQVYDCLVDRNFWSERDPLIVGAPPLALSEFSLANAKITQLIRLLVKVFHEYFQGNVLQAASRLKFNTQQAEILEVFSEDVGTNVLARGDLVRKEGGWKVHELNVGLNQGSGVIGSSFPRLAGFEQPFDTLELWAKGVADLLPKDSPVALVIDSRYLEQSLDSFAIFTRELKKYRQGFIDCLGHEDLVYDGVQLQTRKGKPVRTIIRFFNENNIEESPESYKPIMQAVKAKHVMCPMGPTYNLLGNKGTFALLWELIEEGILTESEQTLVSEFVPYTTFLNDRSIERVLLNKDQIVLKPINLLQGIDVVWGKEASMLEWETKVHSLVKQADTRAFIAQDYVGPELGSLTIAQGDCLFEQDSQIWWCFHTFNEEPIGGFVRGRPQGASPIFQAGRPTNAAGLISLDKTEQKVCV